MAPEWPPTAFAFESEDGQQTQHVAELAATEPTAGPRPRISMAPRLVVKKGSRSDR